MASPTSRTLALLRGQGFTAEVTEHWNMHTKQRKDLFGFGDILAYNETQVILVQATSASNVTARIKKIKANPHLATWLQSPNRLVWVIGWRKYAEPVERKYWRHTLERIDAE